MTMNSTLMPDFHLPTLSVDFNQFRDTAAGADAPGGGMAPYVRRLDTVLGAEDVWQRRPRIVVGHSFGGMLALSWILAHSSDDAAGIDGLVLIATSAGPLWDRIRLRLGSIGGRDVRVRVAPVMPIWNRPLVTRAAKLLLAGPRSEPSRVDFRSLRRTSDFALDLAGWRNTDWRAMRSYRLAVRGFDVRDRLGKIAVPTIILHGTRDSLFAVDEAERLAAGLPSAELRIVDGAGHGLPLTHGGEVVRAVGDQSHRNSLSARP
jgi:pimeloyl-ACP methyl ester carboxylesterase